MVRLSVFICLAQYCGPSFPGIARPRGSKHRDIMCLGRRGQFALTSRDRGHSPHLRQKIIQHARGTLPGDPRGPRPRALPSFTDLALRVMGPPHSPLSRVERRFLTIAFAVADRIFSLVCGAIFLLFYRLHQHFPVPGPFTVSRVGFAFLPGHRMPVLRSRQSRRAVLRLHCAAEWPPNCKLDLHGFTNGGLLCGVFSAF